MAQKPAPKPPAKKATVAPAKPAAKPAQAQAKAPPKPVAQARPEPGPVTGLPAQRQKAYDSLPAEGKKFCDFAITLTKTAASTSVLDMHRLGIRARALLANGKHGEAVMKNIAVAIFGSAAAKTLIYDAKRLADLYPEAKLKKMLATASKNQIVVLPGHLRYLLGLTGPYEKKRLRLEEKLVTQGMTVKELNEETRKGGKRATGPAVPATPEAGLTKLIGAADTFVAQEDVWTSAILNPLLSLDDAEFTPKMVTSMQTASGRLRQQADLANSMADQFDQIVGRVSVEPEGESAETEGEEPEEPEEPTGTVNELEDLEEPSEEENTLDDGPLEEDDEDDETDPNAGFEADAEANDLDFDNGDGEEVAAALGSAESERVLR